MAEHSDIEYVLTRDERTASYVAEAYAKVTGRPCVLEAPSPGVTPLHAGHGGGLSELGADQPGQKSTA